jgi:hypothetical protein
MLRGIEIRAPNPDPDPVNWLEAVLAPACPLADVDGVTLLLVSVELWTTGVFMRLAGLGTARTKKIDEEFYAALDASQGRDSPEHPGERFGRLPLALADDLGTSYAVCGTSASGTGSEWRAEWQFAPGVPRAAARLIVTLEREGGRLVHELVLPAR